MLGGCLGCAWGVLRGCRALNTIQVMHRDPLTRNRTSTRRKMNIAIGVCFVLVITIIGVVGVVFKNSGQYQNLEETTHGTGMLTTIMLTRMLTSPESSPTSERQTTVQMTSTPELAPASCWTRSGVCKKQYYGGHWISG